MSRNVSVREVIVSNPSAVLYGPGDVRIEDGTVGGDAHDGVGVRPFGCRAEPVQDIELASLEHAHARASPHRSQRGIREFRNFQRCRPAPHAHVRA